MSRKPAVLLALLLLLSCSRIPFKIGETIPEGMVTPEDKMILKRLEDRRSQFRSLRGVVKATFESPVKTSRVKLIVLNQGNRRIRVEALTPLDQPLYVLILTPDSMDIFDASDGTVKKEKLQRGSKVAFHDLIVQTTLLLSLFSSNIEDHQYRFMESPKEKQEPWTLFLADEQKNIYRIRTHEGGDYPKEIVKINKEEKTHIEVEFNSYKVANDYPCAQEIVIQFPPQHVTAHLQFDEVEVMDQLEDDLFNLDRISLFPDRFFGLSG